LTTISVVVPTYNRAVTLRRALISIQAQTLQPDEVIVVDDGSTDNTSAVLADFPTVRILRLDRTLGAAGARNAGVRYASSHCIAFLDSDDAWEPSKLDQQLRALESPAAPDLVCTGVIVTTCAGTTVRHGLAAMSPATGWTFREFQTYPFAPSTWLIRRSVFAAVGFFDETLPNCEDLDLLARMSGRHRMQLLAEPLVRKHNLPDSLDSNVARTAASLEILFERHALLWSRAPEAAVASYVRLANMHMRAGDPHRARGSLWRALVRQPRRLESWALLGASLLGPRVYRRIARRVT
jgi:glycosyltransferase involved in cell wall biosynthesis